MKKYFLILFLIIFCQNLISQNVEPLSSIQKTLYEFENVQVKPEFPAGKEKFIEYVQTNFKKSDSNKNNTEHIQTSFIVEMDGSITNVNIKNIEIKKEKKLRKILEKSPKWLPGEHEGYHVRTRIDFAFDI